METSNEVGLECTFKDGTKRTFKVRRMERSEFPSLSRRWVTEEGEADCYLGEEGIAEHLSDESFDQVMEEGRRLNWERFRNWFIRQYQRLEILNGGGGEAIKAALTVVKENPDLLNLPARR